MRISDWSSDVCSSDLLKAARGEEDMRQHLASGHSAARCLAGIFLALICLLPASCTDSRDTNTVGSKNFGESNVLAQMFADRKSVGEGTSVSVRVDLGGRRFIKKKINRLHSYRH